MVVLEVLLIPVILFVAGLLMYKFPPKEINSIVGYRTRRSSKSKHTWAYANKRAGQLFMIFAVILLVLIGILSLLLHFIFKSDLDEYLPTVSIIMFFISIALLVIIVQTELKRKFDSDGNPID